MKNSICIWKFVKICQATIIHAAEDLLCQSAFRLDFCLQPTNEFNESHFVYPTRHASVLVLSKIWLFTYIIPKIIFNWNGTHCLSVFAFYFSHFRGFYTENKISSLSRHTAFTLCQYAKCPFVKSNQTNTCSTN